MKLQLVHVYMYYTYIDKVSINNVYIYNYRCYFAILLISLSLGKTPLFRSNDSLTGRQGFQGRSAARNEERKGKRSQVTEQKPKIKGSYVNYISIVIVVYEYVYVNMNI